MRRCYIGGDMHGQSVPAELQRHAVIDFDRPGQRATLRYVRTGFYFIIFGMTPVHSAPLIAELETPA